MDEKLLGLFRPKNCGGCVFECDLTTAWLYGWAAESETPYSTPQRPLLSTLPVLLKSFFAFAP